MAIYHVNFDISYDETYSSRYDDFTKAVQKNATMAWNDPTSCIIIQTTETLDAFAARLKASKFNASKDLFIVINTEVKAARICGQVVDQSIFKLLPFIKKV